jgi:hypothetical protein
MIDDIRAYIKKCAPCQQSKHNNRKEAGELRPTEIPDRPWQHITIDLITDLPKSKGYDSILVIVDKFSKMVRYIPCTKKITAQETAQHLARLYDLIGIPEKIISDRGPQFAAKYTQELNRLLGIETALSTAYHPQTDGQTERVNQELENYLRMYCGTTPTQWVDWLSLAEAAHNGRYHTSTGMTPHMIVYGYDKKTLDDVKRMQSDNDVAQEFVSDKKEMWKIVKANLLKAQQDMKRHADASRRPVTFKKGDHVWLSTADLQGIHKKLGPLRLGPFEITDTVRDNPNAYRLQLPPTMKIHPVINVSRLLPADPEIPLATETPEVEDGNPAEEPAEILDSRQQRRGGFQYLVRYGNDADGTTTWVKYEKLTDYPDLIAGFHRRHPVKPRPKKQMNVRIIGTCLD